MSLILRGNSFGQSLLSKYFLSNYKKLFLLNNNLVIQTNEDTYEDTRAAYGNLLA